MAEFVTMALDNELHPKFEQKEKNNMGKMRTVAFQVPEELFNRVKDYLHRNNISQKDFVLGLIEDELDREQAERETLTGMNSPMMRMKPFRRMRLLKILNRTRSPRTQAA